MSLYSFEIALLVVYLLATFGLAIYFGRKGREAASATEYFLAGRALPWYLIGLSFYASNMSGASFVGLIGASYAHGLAIFHYEWTAALVLVIFAAFILPVFLRARLFTVTEYLERRFEPRTRVLYSLFTLVTLLFIDMAGALYAGAVVMVTGLPFLDLWTACIVISLLTGLYTIFGGLRTVVITDALQALVLIVGASFVAVYGLAQVGGWHALVGELDKDKLQLFRSPDDDVLPWPGILGVVVLGLYYWTFNQYFVQRALAARSLQQGRWGALFGGLLKLPNLFLMIVPGLVAAALYPTLESPDKAFPTLTFELLPVGLRGIVLAAMLAAIMSSLDSALNAASSLVTMDLVKPLRRDMDERALFVIGRITTGAFMIVAAIYAPLIAGFGSLFEYFQSTLAYLVPPFVGIYLGGLLSPALSRRSAFWALLIVEPLAIVLFLTVKVFGLWSAVGLPDLHFTYVAILLLSATLVVMGLFSWLERAPRRQVALETTFSYQDLTPRPGDRLLDYRLLAALLLLATVTALIVLGAYEGR
jgi:SSS family solute:Na+ symporter